MQQSSATGATSLLNSSAAQPAPYGGTALEMTERSKILRNAGQPRSFDTGTSLGSPTSSAAPDWDPSKAAAAAAAAEEEGEELRSSLPMTAFNVINSIIGSGIIGMPYALKSSGVGLGLLLLVLISVITDYSVNLIIMGGALSNTMTYQEMVRVAYGKPGYILITVMQAVYPFIAMISYNVIIGDTLTKIIVRIGGDRVANTILAERNFTVFLATVAILIPLSLYKNIAKLSKTSLLSTGIICLILLSMAIRAPVYAAQVVPSEYEWTFANSRIPQSIAIMAFAFMCQHNTYLCFHSLQQRSLERWALVVHLAVGFAMLASSLFGLVGFASFATGVQGDILENYCPRDDLINLSRLLFAVTIMLTYPMECFVVREVVENYFFQQPAPLWRHILLTTGIVALAYLASMTTSCVSIVLEINGVLTAAPLAFILPPLCVMRLQNEPFFRLPNLAMLATAAFGIVVAVSGSIMVAMDLAEGVRCSQGSELPYCWGNTTKLARAYGQQAG